MARVTCFSSAARTACSKRSRPAPGPTTRSPNDSPSGTRATLPAAASASRTPVVSWLERAPSTTAPATGSGRSGGVFRGPTTPIDFTSRASRCISRQTTATTTDTTSPAAPRTSRSPTYTASPRGGARHARSGPVAVTLPLGIVTSMVRPSPLPRSVARKVAVVPDDAASAHASDEPGFPTQQCTAVAAAGRWTVASTARCSVRDMFPVTSHDSSSWPSRRSIAPSTRYRTT